jgi:hypothetical protein
MHFTQKLLTPALSHTVLLQQVWEFFRQPWHKIRISSMLLVPDSHVFVLSPPSAVKKESLSSMDKEGVDSSESGESLVIG